MAPALVGLHAAVKDKDGPRTGNSMWGYMFRKGRAGCVDCGEAGTIFGQASEEVLFKLRPKG